MARKSVQAVTASQAARIRMAEARKQLPKSVGQQDVMYFVVEQAPHLDRLTYANRWHNAWVGRVADLEITELIERAVLHFKEKEDTTRTRLRRQKIHAT